MAANVDALRSFTAGVLQKITDPDQKRKAEEAINTLITIEPAAGAFGDGVLAQSELSRKLDDLRTQQQALETQRTQLQAEDERLQTWHTQLTDWKAANDEALAWAKAHRTGNGNGGTPKAGDKGAAPTTGITAEQLTETLQAERAGYLGYERDRSKITREHFAKFNEIVDVEPLLTHPRIAELGLIGVYQLIHKDRLEKYDTDKRAADEERIRADERTKVLAQQAQMPYPTPTGAGSGSPLDALQPSKADSVVDAATAHYQRLQQERAAREGTGGRT